MARVFLQGQLHRARYDAGGSIKVFVHAECTDKPMVGLDRAIPYEPSQLSPSSRASTWGSAGGAYPSDTPVAVILSMSAEFVGVCTTDSNRISCSLEGTQSLDTPLAQGPKPNALRSLFNWGRVTPAEPSSNATSPSATTKVPPTLHKHFSASKSEETHLIFNSPAAELASEVGLRLFETCKASLRCDIPPNIPPSFVGYCARYAYAVIINCEYETYGQRRSAILRIPVRIDSPVAAEVLVRSPYVQGGISVDDHRGDTDFNFNLQHTSATSTVTESLKPSLLQSPPTSDALFSEGPVPKAAAPMSRLPPRPYEVGVPAPNASGPTPQPYLLRCGTDLQYEGPPAAVTVLLWDTSVLLGEQLRGVLTSPANQEPQHGVCLRVVAALEATESAPKRLFRAGSVIPRESEDEATFVVAHCTAFEEIECYIPYSGGQIPFSLPLTNSRCQQTMRTDIVSNQWRLRMVFYFAMPSAAAAALAAKGELSTVPIVEKLQEVIIPLTVLPSGKCPRMGQMVSVAEGDHGTKW